MCYKSSSFYCRYRGINVGYVIEVNDTYIHTYIHTCIHTYIHTYIQTDRQTDRQTDVSDVQYLLCAAVSALTNVIGFL